MRSGVRFQTEHQGAGHGITDAPNEIAAKGQPDGTPNTRMDLEPRVLFAAVLT
jgi:hypothetical protein